MQFSSSKLCSSPKSRTEYTKEFASAEAMIELHKGSFTGQQLFVNQENSSGDNSDSNKSAVPKKRWLREAVLEQQKWDSNQDLAKPINWGDEVNIIESENQKRPTVLVRVDQGEKKEISKADLQIAMALVELKNTPGPAASGLYHY